MSSRTLVIQHRARPARSRSARIAVTAVFVAHGLLFASWTAHIPHIMQHLGLTDGTLGIALLGAPVGSVTAMLLASYLIPICRKCLSAGKNMPAIMAIPRMPNQEVIAAF